MKNNRILVVVVSFVICSIVVFNLISLACSYEVVDVDIQRYYVKAPENFNGNAFCKYNREYVNQENKDGVIKFIFLKNGYYHVNIGRESYVFRVNIPDGEPIENYENELRHIEKKNLDLIFVSTLICMSLISAFFIVLATIRKKNPKET
ncbi:MAG: hypothetical protein IKV94_00575 [Clostridia bacterium]|nr:hypothetical protein [Clostridia bacterium]